MSLMNISKKKELDDRFLMEINLIQYPFFFPVKKKKFYHSDMVMVDGEMRDFSCEGMRKHGGLPRAFDLDIFATIMKIWLMIGQPRNMDFMIDLIIDILNYSKSMETRIRKSLRRMEASRYSYSKVMHDPDAEDEDEGEGDRIYYLIRDLKFHRGGRITFTMPDFIMRNVIEHAYFQFMDFAWYKKLKSGVPRSLYMLLERNRYKERSMRIFFAMGYEKLCQRVPILIENVTHRRDSLLDACEELVKHGYLRSYTHDKNAGGDTIFRFFYSHASPSQLESKTMKEDKEASELRNEISDAFNEETLTTDFIKMALKKIGIKAISEDFHTTQKLVVEGKTEHFMALVNKRIENNSTTSDEQEATCEPATSERVQNLVKIIRSKLKTNVSEYEISYYCNYFSNERLLHFADVTLKNSDRNRYTYFMACLKDELQKIKEFAKKVDQDKPTDLNTEQAQNYSTDIILLCDEINNALSITSIRPDQTDKWFNSIGIEGIRYFVQKTIDNSKDILSRHGYLTKCIETYIQQNKIKPVSKEQSKKETHETTENKQTNDNKYNENMDFDCVTSVSDFVYVKGCKLSIINIFGEHYYKALLDVVMKNPNWLNFNIYTEKHNKSDKGYFIVCISERVTKLSEAVIQQIKTHLEEMYPIENSYTDVDEPNNNTEYQNEVQEEYTEDNLETVERDELKDYNDVRFSSSIKNSGKTAVEYCDDDMEEEDDDGELDDIGYYDDEEDENIVIDIKAKPVKKTVKLIKEKKSKVKDIEMVKDIPARTTIEKPIEFVKMTLTGEQLKEARERAGLSTRDLSKLIDYDQPTISKWEKGRRSIPKNLIPKIREVLNF